MKTLRIVWRIVLKVFLEISQNSEENNRAGLSCGQLQQVFSFEFCEICKNKSASF